MLATVVTLYNGGGADHPATLGKEDRRSVVEEKVSGVGGYSIAGGDDVAGRGSCGFGGGRTVQRAFAIYPCARSCSGINL